MSRPSRQGVDYFPLDVYLDDKFKFIEIKYKLEGFAVLIKLLQKIYSYGYWYNWTEDEALIFADENRADLKLIENVVIEAIKRDIFDKDLYDKYNILTSKGIQKRYKEIVRRRKDVEITTEYLLIDNNFRVIADIVPTSSKHNDVKSTQSKVNKSKVNKSKVNKSKVNKSKEDNSNKDTTAYTDFVNKLLPLYPGVKSKSVRDKKLPKIIKEYGEDKVMECVINYNESIKMNKIDKQYILHESTFWNTRYIDYLDANQQEDKPKEVDVNKPQSIGYKGSGY